MSSHSRVQDLKMSTHVLSTCQLVAARVFLIMLTTATLCDSHSVVSNANGHTSLDSRTPSEREPESTLFESDTIDSQISDMTTLKATIRALEATIHRHKTTIQALSSDIFECLSETANLRHSLLDCNKSLAKGSLTCPVRCGRRTRLDPKEHRRDVESEAENVRQRHRHRAFERHIYLNPTTGSERGVTERRGRLRETRRAESMSTKETEYVGCSPSPSYTSSGHCTVCGGGTSDGWPAACQGRCLEEIIATCGFNTDFPALECQQELVCVDCSNVAASTTPLEQVPCPPVGYGGANTSNLILLLDNNHQLNLTGSFGYGNPYSMYLGSLSLSNTTLDASQFTFANMSIFGNLDLSVAQISRGISDNAFNGVAINGNLNMSATTLLEENSTRSGGITDNAFLNARVFGDVDMSWMIIEGDISQSAFGSFQTQGNFDMSFVNISGSINNEAFVAATIIGNFSLNSAVLSGSITDSSFGVIVDGDFDMRGASVLGEKGISAYAFRRVFVGGDMLMGGVNIVGGIGSDAFHAATVNGNFDLSFATISNGISGNAFLSVVIHQNFDMHSATITGSQGISISAFQNANIFNFDMSYANITGGISDDAFDHANIEGNFNMSHAHIGEGITFAAFGRATIGGVFDMSYATIDGGIREAGFNGAVIHGNFDMTHAIISDISTSAFEFATVNGDLDMSFATIDGGISGGAFYGMFVSGNVSLVGATLVDGGIEPGVFGLTAVEGGLNASGARFPNNTLPIQMLYGLEVRQGLDFSHCNLQHLEQKQCHPTGCLGQLQNEFGVVETGLEGGPFTGMAMPVGISEVTVNLSHNNLVSLSNTSLLGITATILDLSHNHIDVYEPFWFSGVPNAKIIDTTGNPSTCTRNIYDSTNEEVFTYQETTSIRCECASGTYGTGNFCAKQGCSQTLNSLNAYSQKYLGGGNYTSPIATHHTTVPAGESIMLHCPAGTHPNNASTSAMSAQCLGGAFPPLTNECVNIATPSWFTSGRIVGIVFAVLIVAAIMGYFVLLSPEKQKRQRLANALGISVNEVELNERLLHETNCDLEEATALNTRMRGAWKIEEDDVDIGFVMASGAFGVVHDGTFAGLRVAIKVLKQPLDEENYPDVGKDFTRECETLMAIRHACLLIFYGAGLTSEKRPFMVTEFMSKGSLKKVLADKGQKLPWPMRNKFALQIAKAMEYLHALGVVHRDLKSDNCLVNSQLDVKVCDFGTSKFLTAGRSTLHVQQSMLDVEGSVTDVEGTRNDPAALFVTMTKGVGTALWMAPELFVGGTKYKQEVDMYSFGVIMWELVTREEPWNEIKETNYIEFFAALSTALENSQRPHIPVVVEEQSAFVALMKICWATDPHSRPTFAQVVNTLSL